MSSQLEEGFAAQCKMLKVAIPACEYKFHPTRKWRFDFAWPERKIAVEIEGGIWINGRHARGGGYEKDCEKYNAAALLGWRVFRFTAKTIKNWVGAQMMKDALN